MISIGKTEHEVMRVKKHNKRLAGYIGDEIRSISHGQ